MIGAFLRKEEVPLRLRLSEMKHPLQEEDELKLVGGRGISNEHSTRIIRRAAGRVQHTLPSAVAERRQQVEVLGELGFAKQVG